jgi:hypothetical protein
MSAGISWMTIVLLGAGALAIVAVVVAIVIAAVASGRRDDR